jgi:uncharacterized protein YlxW (UPF0749 family)
MSIRMIARDLYRLQKEVETLERQMASVPYERRSEMENQLRKLRAERDRMRRVLEGTKEEAPYRKPL